MTVRPLLLALVIAACASDRQAPSGDTAKESKPAKEVKLLNVSYDPRREIYTAINAAFGRQLFTIDEVFGGSRGGHRARSRDSDHRGESLRVRGRQADRRDHRDPASGGDRFYKLGLIPRPIVVRDAVWLPPQS